MKVVVTGASGFVGRELVALLSERTDWDTVAASRQRDLAWPGRVRAVDIPDLDDASQHARLADLVAGADAVVHLAARTPTSGASKDISTFKTANSDAVERLVRACASHGVKRFILMSSSRVSGAISGERPIDELSPPAPDDGYASSKLLAEQAVMAAAANGSVSWTIVRPPLIYGPGMKGPLLQLTRAIIRGIPLPLGAITANQRDMIGVRNISRFIELCLQHPNAANELFVIRDGEPKSTRGLIEAIAQATHRSVRLLPIPAALLALAAKLAGRGEMVERLIGDHRIEDAKARRQLGWRAEVPVQFDLDRMTRALSS